MTRALFFGVDHDADPPIVSAWIVGRPHREVRFAIERRATPRETEVAAIAELDATPRPVLEAMAVALI